MTTSRRNAGFSLPELIIALGLGTLVSAAFIALFVGFRSASGTSSGAAAIADHGRFALGFLGQAVRTAGYYACGTPKRAYLVISNPTNLYYNFLQPFTGFEGKNTSAQNTSPGNTVSLATPTVGDTTSGDWALPPTTAQPAPGAALTTLLNNVGGAVRGNDILVVRGAPAENQLPSGATSTIFTSGPAGNPSTSFTASPAPTNFTPGQLAAISDCGRVAVIFQLTSTPANLTAGTIKTDTSGGLNTSNYLGPFTFQAGAQVSMVDTAAYYIGVGEDGDGALYRADLLQNGPAGATTMAPVELVPDIEAMQVLYGVDPSNTIDSDSSLFPTAYVTADQVPDFNTVVSVKIGLLAASPPSSGSIVGAAAQGAVPNPTPQTYTLLGTTVTVPAAVIQASGPRLRQVFEINITAHNIVN